MAVVNDRGELLPRISACVLGQTQVFVGERTIADHAWRLRSARALLLLLLITPGHALPRDRVLDLIWTEAEPDAALRSFYKALHSLRRVLEPDLDHGRESAYVGARSEVIQLHQAMVGQIDAEEFEQVVRGAASVPSARRPALLRTAIALYQGDLLPTELYADWPVARRETLRRLYQDAVLELAELEAAAGRPHATVAELEVLLATDRTLEAAHRALMRAYAAAGQRDRALRQYLHCRTALAEELGSEPDELTEEVRSTIERAVSAPSTVQQPGANQPAPMNNLPLPPTPLVGREREIEAIQGLLWRQDVRLVTLTGTGGIGKTRLALAVAAGVRDDYADGVAFVNLAPVREHGLVVATIAYELGMPEDAARPVAASLATFLRDRELLLVLDNFEHVLEAGPAIAALLASCPRLNVLTTSREHLRLRGEHEVEVAPLSVPDSGRPPAVAVLERYESVALLRQCLQARHPTFSVSETNASTVVDICVHLEGLPLAIELAAEHVRPDALDRLLAELTARLDVLVAGPRDLPDRQRALRDTIAWSYNLLGPAEQHLFRHLAVFAGGLTADAATAVAGIDTEMAPLLTALTDKHLLRREDPGAEPRWSMLETIRDFGLEMLRAHGNLESAGRIHAEYYLALATRAEAELVGAEQGVWLDRLTAEHDNLRAALALALDATGPLGDRAVRAAGGLWRFWSTRGYTREGRAWLERCLRRNGTLAGARAAALYAAAELADDQGDFEQAGSWFDDALALYRSLHDETGMAHAFRGLGAIAHGQGEYDRARELHQQALALYQAVGHQRGIASAMNNLATVAYYRGDVSRATELWEDVLGRVRELGDCRAEGLILGNLGSLAVSKGDGDKAVAYHQAALDIARALDDISGTAHGLINLGGALQLCGDPGRTAIYDEALELSRRMGDRYCEAMALVELGDLALQRQDLAQASSLAGQGLALLAAIGHRTAIADAAILERLAAVAMASRRSDLAAWCCGAAEVLRGDLGASLSPIYRTGYERSVSSARAALGAAAFGSAWARGRAMELDHIASAISSLAVADGSPLAPSAALADEGFTS